MKKDKFYVYLPMILGIVLIILSILNSFENNNVWGIIGGVLLIIIPYVYTSIPIIYERYKENNSLKNRLSENTFTDRQTDLQNLISLLHNHKIIQLTGNERQCGKSWLALKLIDCINHPNDVDFIHHHSLKKLFKRIYYIDMKQKSDSDINYFFENNIVTNKTLIIIDHIKKVDYIFSKQEAYNFSLIFITASIVDTKGEIYYISSFEIDNVPKLQKNINRNYNNIEILSKKEIETLYEVTYGNIGKIHFLLERQEYVLWIKQLALKLQTNYDKTLNTIQLALFSGKYVDAQNFLDIFQSQYEKELLNNNDLYFKFNIMKSDCEHLLNNYENALAILNILKKPEMKVYNIENRMEILEAHFNKHLWKCNEALNILQSIESSNICGLTDSLGILVAKYFVDDLIVPNCKLDSLSAFIHVFEKCKDSKLEMNPKDIYKIMRNESIYLFYKKKYTRKNILEPINSVILKYKKENNRLLANAYFIRAEINRLFQKYKATLLDYNRCLTITDDDNIKIQVNIMKYYLDSIKKITIFKTDNHLSKEQIYKLCNNKNKYGMLLIQRINCIELDDPNKDQITYCFEHRIMTIL